MIETIRSIITATIIILISQALSKYFTPELFAATFLVATTFSYVGFSAKGSQTNSTISEVSVALVFYFIAIIGYTKNTLVISCGILLHGVWDLVRHKGLPSQTKMPGNYSTICFIVDIIDGLFFPFLFKTNKKHGPIPLKSFANS